MQRPQSSVIMLIVIVAVILAIASSLALAYIQSRPDSPEEVAGQPEPAQEGLQVVNVEGVDVLIERSDENALFLLPPGPRDEGATNVQPEQQTEQPTQAPEPTAAPDVQPTQAPEAQAQPTTAPGPSGSVNTGVAPVIFQDYVVQGNDTLYNITRQLETSITLMAIHGIDQDDLVVGITLKIPIGNPAYCPSLRPYAVGEGDTVFAIATRRNTTVENIRTINQLNAEYDIQAGEVLCVP